MAAGLRLLGFAALILWAVLAVLRLTGVYDPVALFGDWGRAITPGVIGLSLLCFYLSRRLGSPDDEPEND